MRRAALLLAAALAASAAPAWAAAVKEAPAPAALDDKTIQAWLAANIDAPGDMFIDTSSQAAYFLGPTSSAAVAPLTRMQQRREYFTPQSSKLGFRYRSAINVIELDCANTRQRVLTIQAYEFSNLQGERRSQDEQAPQWRYPREGTIAERELFLTCGALAMDPAPAKPKTAGLLK